MLSLGRMNVSYAIVRYNDVCYAIVRQNDVSYAITRQNKGKLCCHSVERM